MTVTAQIARAEVRRVSGRVAGAANATRAWTERHGLLVRLVDADGRVGLGDVSPLPGYSPDTLEACEAALLRATEEPLPPIEHGDSIEATVRDALDAVGIPVELPAARFGFETALLDLLGQIVNAPVAGLLSRRPRNHVPLAALITGDDPAAILDGVAAARKRGVSTIKLKIGRPKAFAAECELIASIRERFGPTLAIRLDANGAWNPDEAMHRLGALAQFRPEFVEQPVAPDRLVQLVGAPVPLAADESLHATMCDPLEVFRSGACQVAVLKPTVLGGAMRCRALANDARALGLEAIVSHTFEGPVALAACAELAFALPGTRAAGLAPHGGLAAWPIARLPQLRGDHLTATDRVGLGVELEG